jgi:Ca-activated chloride channel homolog
VHHRVLAGGLVVFLCAPLAGSPPRQERPSFKVEVNHVEVTARVTDDAGAFVADLGRADFEILEDGRPQEISDFALIDLTTTPRSLVPTAWPDAEPDVSSNARAFDGRVYVLVLDSLHVSAERSGEVRRLARRFLQEYFADGDMAAVVNTTGAAEPAQELTASRPRLLAAVDKFAGQKGGGAPAVRRTTESAEADDVLSSLKTLTELLSGVQGRRKAVVFFSEGPSFCLDVQLKTGSRGVLSEASRALVAAANRGNVAIYGVDPRGLDPSILDCDLDAGIQSLRSLSDGTGGFATVNSNDFIAGFDRIRLENSRYYILGYYPPEREPNGAFRQIEVRARRSGLHVEARQGYMAPRRTTVRPREASPGQGSAVLLRAMDSVLPVSGLRLSASAVPFRGGKAGADLLVSLVVDGRDITFAPTGVQLKGGLELAIGTMNSRGEHGANVWELVEMPLEEGSRAAVTGFGIRIVRTVPVAPGRHQLRIGVLDRPTGRAGVVHLDVIVNDYLKTPFDMSGVLLTSSLAGRVPTARGGPLEQLQAQLPGPPALTREFRGGEELALYAELYGARGSARNTIAVASVLNESGTEVIREDPAGSGGAAGGAGGAATLERVEIRRRIPLRSLQPGRYLLRVEARAASGKPESVRRDVPFTVVR